MQIEVKEEKDKVTLIEISGEIDLYNAPDIKENIQKLVEAQKFKIVLDMQGVSYIDSSGIGAMISALSGLKRHKGGLKLANLHGPVKKVFELTKLNSFFEIYDDPQKAIESFKSR